MLLPRRLSIPQHSAAACLRLVWSASSYTGKAEDCVAEDGSGDFLGAGYRAFVVDFDDGYSICACGPFQALVCETAQARHRCIPLYARCRMCEEHYEEVFVA